ncbi:uncharacterized protein LOC108051248 isoform X2 [Drosophila rhopaloa]|nr:uncharacterized protein LOC108051248 isoform X2 [Drosophila rhopaloa]
MVDLGPITKPKTDDYPKKVSAFLERHFGRNPQVSTLKATQQRLASLQLNALVAQSEVNFQDREAPIWHTWLVEKIQFPPTQCAVIREWKDPFTETLASCYCSWHLENCMAWQMIIGNKRAEAKCFCLRIKKIMDIANNLVNPELEQNAPAEDGSPLVSVSSEKVLDATDLLKQLNKLLELQEKRNRQYKRLLKVLKDRDLGADPLMSA